MLVQSGIPVLYSGDEVGQLNDYTYKEDPAKCADSRYLHRGSFPWHLVEEKDEISMRLFAALRKLETARAEHDIFGAEASVWTFDTGCRSVLGIGRYLDGKKLLAYFNFSGDGQKIEVPPETDKARYEELITKKKMDEAGESIDGYGYYWFYDGGV